MGKASRLRNWSSSLMASEGLALPTSGRSLLVLSERHLADRYNVFWGKMWIKLLFQIWLSCNNHLQRNIRKMFDKTSGYHSMASFRKLTIEARVFSANKGKFVILGMYARELCIYGKNSTNEQYPQLRKIALHLKWQLDIPYKISVFYKPISGCGNLKIFKLKLIFFRSWVY